MKKLFIYSTIAAFSFILNACGHADTADQEPAFVLTSDEIVSEFLDDQQAANQKFNDLVIQISGPVMDVSKENGMVIGIKLSSDEFNIVNCTFQNPVNPDEISGEQLTIKGVCSGFMGDETSMLPGGTVEIKRASIVK